MGDLLKAAAFILAGAIVLAVSVTWLVRHWREFFYTPRHLERQAPAAPVIRGPARPYAPDPFGDALELASRQRRREIARLDQIDDLLGIDSNVRIDEGGWISGPGISPPWRAQIERQLAPAALAEVLTADPYGIWDHPYDLARGAGAETSPVTTAPCSTELMPGKGDSLGPGILSDMGDTDFFSSVLWDISRIRLQISDIGRKSGRPFNLPAWRMR